MVRILLDSHNEAFKNDLQLQLTHLIDDIIFTSTLPDIIIVDENPQKYMEIRQEFPTVPMFFLAESSLNKNDNLNIFIPKPFSLMHLADELQAANNRLDNSSEGYLQFNAYELHPDTREIIDLINNTSVKLTEKEVDILQYLYKHNNKYASKADLQKNVWKYHEEVTTHTIETHIYRLRQKVEQNSARRLILTENGGYKLKRD